MHFCVGICVFQNLLFALSKKKPELDDSADKSTIQSVPEDLSTFGDTTDSYDFTSLSFILFLPHYVKSRDNRDLLR